jgi:hypothetical protein
MKNSILELAEKIKEKSRPTRTAYLKRVKALDAPMLHMHLPLYLSIKD